MKIYSANEYWVKSASLCTPTRPATTLPYTRNYLMSSMQHGTGDANDRGACSNQNPLSSNVTQRALCIALDEWSNEAHQPP